MVIAQFTDRARQIASLASRRTMLSSLLGLLLLGHAGSLATGAKRKRKRRRKRRRPHASCRAICKGCCDGETCVAVTSDQRCGFDGEPCAPCPPDNDCISGICRMIVVDPSFGSALPPPAST